MRDESASNGTASGDEPSAARFAARLRQLRADAGAPSFRQMAKITHYSASTLAEATSGRRLPTAQVVTAFAVACGADPEQWRGLLDDAVKAHAAEALTDPEPEILTGPEPRPRKWSRGVVIAMVVAGFGTGFAAGMLTARTVAAGSEAESGASPGAVVTAVPSFAPTAQAMDGTDPIVGHCTDDAELVDKTPVLIDGRQIGAMEIRYSPFCGAGWARLYLYPAQPMMFGKVTIAAADGRSVTFANPLVKQEAIWTDVIIPGGTRCLTAEGVVYATGKPPATASTPCEALAPAS